MTLCDLCGLRDATIKAEERKKPKRIVLMCRNCYASNKPIGYAKTNWKIYRWSKQYTAWADIESRHKPKETTRKSEIAKP